MAEEVEMIPVDAAEPPKADPLAAPKPGLKLPPKPAVGPGAGLKPGLKLPPKPPAVGGAAPAAGLKPGLKLPTQNALKPGVRLPPKPVIRKPGSTATAAPLPKPIGAKPVAVDTQGVGRLPTVEAKAISKGDAAPAASEPPQKPLEALKSVTQKLKGITQEIPQQAILRKTGIIADGAMSDAQKEAAKHKTARISLSDAIGVAPVKNENAPIKTIRIKRPVDIPGGTKPLTPRPPSAAQPAAAPAAPAAEPAEQAADSSAPTATQRKTLKINRPGGGAVRPAGKFGIKRPGGAESAASGDAGAVGDIPDISDIPDMPVMAPYAPPAKNDDGPAWVWTLSALVQLAACAVVGALAWFLYTNTTTNYF